MSNTLCDTQVGFLAMRRGPSSVHDHSIFPPHSMKPSVVLAMVLLAAPLALQSQVVPTTPAAPVGSTLRVFVDDCPCDLDYLRTELTYVDYVRDRADADVHLLFGNQGTGAGGRAYTLYFIGLRAFAGAADTLTFATEPSSPEDQTRQTLVRYIKMGLVRYVARTAAADRIRITLAPAATSRSANQAAANDPWNFWVFRTSLGGGGNGEKSRSRISTNGSLSATRTTERWKARISTNGNYNESKVTFPNRFDTVAVDPIVVIDTILGRIDRAYSHSINANAYLVRSLGPHFSTGVTASASASSFANNDLFLRVAPAFEYSIYPYSESTRRQLVFNYSIGVNALDYDQETIYFKTSQQVLDHQLQVSYEVTQPWGSAFGGLSGQQYLHDTHLYAVSAFMFANIRLFKGFSLTLNGNASTIYNQISIQRRRLSDFEVLQNRRQQVTPYRVSGNVGISYTFGSIYNNIVNPRFNSTGGGGEFFFF